MDGVSEDITEQLESQEKLLENISAHNERVERLEEEREVLAGEIGDALMEAIDGEQYEIHVTSYRSDPGHGMSFTLDLSAVRERVQEVSNHELDMDTVDTTIFVRSINQYGLMTDDEFRKQIREFVRARQETSGAGGASKDDIVGWFVREGALKGEVVKHLDALKHEGVIYQNSDSEYLIV